MNTNVDNSLPAWLPLVVGVALVAQFAGLGVWQISRGLEKQANQDAYSATGNYSNFQDGEEVRSYQRLKATGRYDAGHQILLDNIILNSRYGYYVLTPLETAEDEALLLINRGWIQKSGPEPDIAAISELIKVGNSGVTVRGRVGSLPKPGMRMGDAILSTDSWPLTAVYPASEDIEAALGREVQPFVLLMEPDSEQGFLRQWVPAEMGPGKHFAYAFQWFAMGTVLAGLLFWHYRKRRPARD